MPHLLVRCKILPSRESPAITTQNRSAIANLEVLLSERSGG